MKYPFVSILIPTYNAQNIISATLRNIASQKYPNYEIIISDDNSTDKTVAIIKKLKIPQVKIFSHQQNVGYEGNLKRLEKYYHGEIIFLMGQDDSIINNGLYLTINEFIKNPNIGAVSRPYYWFFNNINTPIRHIPPVNNSSNIDIIHHPKLLPNLIETLGQLSGLAYKATYFTGFNPYCFTSHIEPFLKIALKHSISILPTYTIAVSTKTSQTRSKSSIYNTSPMLTWIDMVNRVFNNKSQLKKISLDHIGKNYLGFVQLKNYSNFPILLREIFISIKLRPKNLLSLKFLFYCLITICVPTKILRLLTDYYKSSINGFLISRTKDLKKIQP